MASCPSIADPSSVPVHAAGDVDMVSHDAPSFSSGQAYRLSVLVRLALVNSIGYAGSTIVPLWVGDIGSRMGMPGWFGGAVASAQLLAAAVLNLLTPLLFRAVPPSRLARWALPTAALLFLLTLASNPILFACGCLGGGACLGVVLNATNRIIAGSAEVQKGYSIFLLTEGVFSASMFYSGALLSQHMGLNAVFLTLPAVTLLGTCLMASLPHHQLVVAELAPRARRGLSLQPAIGLLALFVCFCGQSCINASTLTLARAAGVSVSAASAALAISVIIGLSGAVVSKQVGERFGVRRPILAATMALALVVSVMTETGSPVAFYVGLFWVQLTTLFILPYFFTMLARLDETGRTASIGPAFLLGGVAVGPSLATLILTVWPPAALGPIASVPLFLSALLTWLASRRLRGQVSLLQS